MSRSDIASLISPQFLREAVRRTLGSAPTPGRPGPARRVGGSEHEGIRLEEFEYTNALGERVPLTVAEPAERRYSAPVIAIHQTNEFGRKEVFGLCGEPSFGYGLDLARRGHRVFSIDLLWTGERAPKAQWDKAGFYANYPEWSMIGKAVEDVHDLREVMAASFGESGRPACIGHSLGGVVAMYYGAVRGGLHRAVCNACYFQTPGDDDPWQTQLYTSQLLNPARRDFCIARHSDLIVSLAAADAPVLLIYYTGDTILERPIPTAGELERMRTYSDRVQAVSLAGPHSYPPAARDQSYQFIEAADSGGAFIPIC